MLVRRLATSTLTVLLLIGGRAVAEIPNEPPVTDADRSHWSFSPVERPEVPQVQAADWSRNPVDRFVLARLEERGLRPMPEADRRTLLRRVTYDLTGLPPTPGEIAAFLDDRDGSAFERVVDRLLASTAYGERWAQHWLDLARFAESDGFEFDHARPNAWRYRDWVIRALNDDMPYDEFLRLQLAGDELRPSDPDAAIATGFLLCGPDMPDINLQQERRHNFLNDMTGTVGSVFLGLQVQCAACHDHKFDPISQFDFYRLRAFFESAEIFGERPIPTPQEELALDEFQERQSTRRQELQTRIEALKSEIPTKTDDRIKSLERELAALEDEKRPPVRMARAVGPSEVPVEPARLWIRGDFRRPGPEVAAGFVRIADASDPATTRGRTRSDLAEWLVSPNHPLTSRVMMNRLWLHHFGEGIVTSPSDFGVMGDWPTHPQLLDWLAAEFIEQGWSLKTMHRLLVLSSTYRTMSSPAVERPVAPTTTSSEVTLGEQGDAHLWHRWDRLVEEDPRNILLGRMRRRRLEGEAVRDAMLAAAGMLRFDAYGPGVFPPLPEEVTGTLRENQWPVSENEADHRRRSVYLFVRRNLPFPLFAAFDRPDASLSCPRRNETTIAPQALHLLNSEFSHACAKGLAERISHHCRGDVTNSITLAYLLTLSRPPTDEDLVLGQSYLAAGDGSSLAGLCLALFNVNEFLYVD